MTVLKQPGRRAFIIGNICLATTIAASAATATPVLTPSLAPNSWSTVAAPEFGAFKRDYFYVLTDDNRPIRLRLLKVIAGDSGPHRPTHLARREGLIAIFNASKADCDWFIANGHQSVNIWHHALGNSRVFLGAVINARGQYKIEMVLN